MFQSLLLLLELQWIKSESTAGVGISENQKGGQGPIDL